MLTQALRNYHIPQIADVPNTEVYFADTYDSVGPLGTKSMSEAPYNPVAPALEVPSEMPSAPACTNCR